MKTHTIVSHQEWIKARLALLEEEKEFTRRRDEMTAKQRSLPWTKLEKDYVFEGSSGSVQLADLFDGSNQLIVYHFMFGEEWEEGCPSCSFWADGFERAVVHLKARDISLAAVSNAHIGKLEAYRKRMGWTFPWVSSAESGFNQDFAVSFDTAELEKNDNNYNFGTQHFGGSEAPGMSVFAVADDGAIYHTYSTYARGLDLFNPAYNYMDVVPKGRDEDDLDFSMAWIKRRDEY